MACLPSTCCVYVCDCVQSALGTIGRECATSRDEFSAAAQAMRNLQRTLVTVEAQEVSQSLANCHVAWCSDLRVLLCGLNNEQQAPAEEWYSDIKSSLLSMLDAVHRAREAAEDEKTAVCSLNLVAEGVALTPRLLVCAPQAAEHAAAVQEERAKTLMLEERASSLEHEVWCSAVLSLPLALTLPAQRSPLQLAMAESSAADAIAEAKHRVDTLAAEQVQLKDAAADAEVRRGLGVGGPTAMLALALTYGFLSSLQARAKKLQERLDSVNAQRRVLQVCVASLLC